MSLLAGSAEPVRHRELAARAHVDAGDVQTSSAPTAGLLAPHDRGTGAASGWSHGRGRARAPLRQAARTAWLASVCGSTAGELDGSKPRSSRSKLLEAEP